jgi:hypothetical protein
MAHNTTTATAEPPTEASERATRVTAALLACGAIAGPLYLVVG